MRFLNGTKLLRKIQNLGLGSSIRADFGVVGKLVSLRTTSILTCFSQNVLVFKLYPAQKEITFFSTNYPLYIAPVSSNRKNGSIKVVPRKKMDKKHVLTYRNSIKKFFQIFA